MEFALIDAIQRRTRLARADVRLGIGDDAALLDVPAGQSLVAAIDTLVAGVHFPLDTAAADIGWKALAVNLSDLAAMGAEPAWALLALTLPQPDAAFVDGLAEGFMALAALHRVALVGGDTTRGPLALSVAMHGFVPPGRALTRAGAQAGDVVMVTGTLGDAAGGLCCVQSDATVAAPLRKALVDRLNRPTPRLAAGLALRGLASACLDVSDGLLADLGHLCERSHVGAEIEAVKLPLSPALQQAFAPERACDFALSGGDDYELCFTVPPGKVDAVLAALATSGTAATVIGRIVAGSTVRVQAPGGEWLAPTHRGWDHFSA